LEVEVMTGISPLKNTHPKTPSRRYGLAFAAAIAPLVVAISLPASAEESTYSAEARNIGRAVGKTVRQAGEKAKEVGSDLAEGAANTGREVGHKAAEVGHKAAEAGRDMVDSAAEAGREAGHAAKETGSEVGHGIAKWFSDVGKAIKEAGRAFWRAIRGES
jgi:hypothetical protein